MAKNKDSRELLVGAEIVRIIHTWETYLSCLRRYIGTMGLDEATKNAIYTMIRNVKDRYLQWHYGNRLWGCFQGTAAYVGPFDVLDDKTFPEVKAAATSIVRVVQNNDLTDDEKRGEIENALESICGGSWKVNDRGYDEPDEKEICDAAAVMIPLVIQEAIASPHKKEVLELEKYIIHSEQFDESTRNQILNGEKHEIYSVTGEVAGELWETTHGQDEGKTILIFVICSNHVLYGWNKTMEQRLRNGSFAITYMAIKEGAGLIPEGTTEREQKIMLSFFLGVEGLFGDIDTPEGSFFGSVKKALPFGYFINCYKPGTHALAHSVSPDLHPLHIVSLMAAMGFPDFVTFYQLRTGETIPEDSSTFAEFLAENMREHDKEIYRDWKERERELFVQLRDIASIPDCMRSESQMATVDEIVISHGQTLIEVFCKCDTIVAQYENESDWSGLKQQLLGVVSDRRFRQYIAYLGSIDKDTAVKICEDNMMGNLRDVTFDMNSGQDPDLQKWFIPPRQSQM